MIWKAVIVDDEPMASSFLQKYCEKHGGIDVLAVFHRPEDASDFLRQTAIDILFLDVEMPGSTGFQLLDILPYMPKVVLTTSKTDYAFDAFQYHVSDYLKKPFTYVRFQEAVNKIIHAGEKQIPAEKPHEDIFIKADGKLTRLNLNDILYIESMGDYVKYFTLQKNYLTLSTLKSVESKMTNKAFMKVHRSFIVNLKKIKDIQDHSLVIEGKVIPISKNLKAEVLERINVV